MKTTDTVLWMFCAALLSALGACRSPGQVFYRAGTSPELVRRSSTRVMLAAYIDSAQEQPVRQPGQGPRKVPQADDKAEDQRPPGQQEPAEEEKKKDEEEPVQYTSPTAALVPFPWLIAGLPAVGDDIGGAGREASESVSLSGLPGFSATQPAVGDSIASLPGFQQGSAANLEFIDPVANLFQAISNPLSGPEGRCTELAGAGFFDGDVSRCVRELSPRVLRRGVYGARKIDRK